MKKDLKRTPLYAELKAAQAKMIDFAGFELPVQFSGIIAEHHAVRNAVGLFDVSHMGRVWIEGQGALECAQYLVTNDVSSLKDGQALYSPMCREDGGIIDDLLVYRLGPERFLFVINSGNHDKDLSHLKKMAPSSVRIIDKSYESGQLALQGPSSALVLDGPSQGKLGQLSFMDCLELPLFGKPCLVSRTGYTGEDGYEIYCDNNDIVHVFQNLIKEGSAWGIVPVGLGARDTLRLEARLCLYGNDIDETTTPLEAGLGWTVRFQAGEFVGKEILERQKQEGVTRRLVGFEMLDKGIARHGYPVVSVEAGAESTPIGFVTSGSPSPTLARNIGLAYLPKKGYKLGTKIGIVIRGRVLQAELVKTPFYKREK